MILRVPAEPSGPLSDAWRHCVNTGRIARADGRAALDLPPTRHEITLRRLLGREPR
ncbi:MULTISPECIES: hypothetical protein [Streptomyces]|uniref:hypothetical protein n=1 Tax=Streptomyces TaxID=1883 RepID=UPI000180340F|nr:MULTISPECIES: hypothetical protein [Streptomyces]MYT09060.1 hypothetical protein [Streptomyces sp. SID5470]